MQIFVVPDVVLGVGVELERGVLCPSSGKPSQTEKLVRHTSSADCIYFCSTVHHYLDIVVSLDVQCTTPSTIGTHGTSGTMVGRDHTDIAFDFVDVGQMF